MDTAGGQAQVKIRCPHCQVIYNIPSSVLGEAGHKVVCSECHNVFSITSPGSSEKPAPKRKSTARKKEDDIIDLDMQGLLDDMERSLERRQAGGQLEKMPGPGPINGSDISPVESTLPDTQPLEDIAPPEIRAPEADAQQNASQQEQISTDKAPPEPPPDAITPDPFVSGQPSHQKSISAPVILLTLLLALSAAAQLAWLQRDRLLENPRARNVAEKICPYLGCRLPPAQQPQTFRILDRIFEPYAPHPGAYQLKLLLRNESTSAQPLPALQLSLLDRGQQVMARRTFTSSDYGHSPGGNILVQPGKTLEAQLLLQPPKNDISGFEIRLIPGGA